VVAVFLNDAPEKAVILNEVAVILNEVAVILNEVAMEAEAVAMEEEEAVGTVEAVEAVEEEKEEAVLEEEEEEAVETVAVGPQVKILQECLRQNLVGIRQGEQECKWQSQRLGTPRLVMAVP
jgi:hypothetical protein